MNVLIVDAFASRAFTGNPAAVCLDGPDLSDSQMQSIAQEFNLSETAFVRRAEAQDRYLIRYFSPKQEIPLCGHATLASARAVIDQTGIDEVRFVNIHGVELVVRSTGDLLEMKLPAYSTSPATAPAALLSALGLESVLNAEYNAETNILLIEMENTDELAALRPDYYALLRSHSSINGVVVTAACGSGEYDFHSRYFWPWSGSDEDPVTGGTHMFLAGYWSQRLEKSVLRSYQSSQRGGSMELEVFDEYIMIRGSAVVVVEGAIAHDALLRDGRAVS
ncbi:MAG: PhzF family phenazine biosynthesis protein [Planctomycetota bacterium]